MNCVTQSVRAKPLGLALLALVGIGACKQPLESPAPAIQMRIYLDSSAFVPGDPIAWRLEIQNITDDSLGFDPGIPWGDYTYSLAGPRGLVPGGQLFIDGFGHMDWLHSGERRSLVRTAYDYFALDTSQRRDVLALPEPEIGRAHV